VVGVTTIALLERKRGISRSLFSRYWRDVHGVMAARIPGFDSYTQHHVIPLQEVGSVRPAPFEGIAVVTFASDANRAGLIHSAITAHIHRDEQNVFRRALLFNLDAGSDRCHRIHAANLDTTDFFLLLPEGCSVDVDAAAAQLENDGVEALTSHDLRSGDPAAWNETDVDDGGAGQRFAAVLHSRWIGVDAGLASIRGLVQASAGEIAAYQVEATYVMVEHGVPTPIGLRGLDAVRTIEEAGAVNQLDPAVVQAIYGTFKAGSL
jgi:hypothetical protein